ncbi:DUF4124 domain-containing protein [Noviherbaspirillum aridicola]|uniref:DUF4124 domain-containing protein n=1 Tax=Noviherbaspirillum aridicola TaxID=2849687 RepID=A0ABQ4Q2I2_9BURK|nr:DUF4124 domain-containing protein [Noviherbaspirillum aridicola]GIZ51217.1 hypothetical protein NCCP691_12310 [Noviherbaspirillum aridicola]
MKQSPLPSLLVLAALLSFGHAGSALAQYAWIDDRGVKQYSDRPPPASVPKARILRQPGGVAAAEGGSPPAPAATAAAAPTIAEKNAEFRKRQAEKAEKEKKSADEAKVAADRRQNCERAADYQRTLESGVRIGTTGKDGERGFLSDEQRARELQETRRVLAGCQ